MAFARRHRRGWAWQVSAMQRESILSRRGGIRGSVGNRHLALARGLIRRARQSRGLRPSSKRHANDVRALRGVEPRSRCSPPVIRFCYGDRRDALRSSDRTVAEIDRAAINHPRFQPCRSLALCAGRCRRSSLVSLHGRDPSTLLRPTFRYITGDGFLTLTSDGRMQSRPKSPGLLSRATGSVPRVVISAGSDWAARDERITTHTAEAAFRPRRLSNVLNVDGHRRSQPVWKPASCRLRRGLPDDTLFEHDGQITKQRDQSGDAFLARAETAANCYGISAPVPARFAIEWLLRRSIAMRAICRRERIAGTCGAHRPERTRDAEFPPCTNCRRP